MKNDKNSCNGKSNCSARNTVVQGAAARSNNSTSMAAPVVTPITKKNRGGKLPDPHSILAAPRKAK